MRTALPALLAAILWTSVPAAPPPTALVVVERQTDNDLFVLRQSGIPVVMEMQTVLLVRGDEAYVPTLREMGFAASILDRDADLWDYMVVGLRPDSDLKLVHRLGPTLLARENWVLIRVPSEASLESLHAARVWPARVPRVPVLLPASGPHAGLGGPEEDGAGPDPLVQHVVDTVSDAEIFRYWSDLTSNPPTGTRYTTSQGCEDASAYCLGVYQDLDIPAEYHVWSGSNAPNVIGTRLGAVNPDDIYIVIAHLDDLPSSGPAPGADDNGSGSALVLETARAMTCQAFRNTVRYINVTGEETGLNGSTAYAEEALNRGDDILGVLNFDMPGWEGNGSPSPENLDVSFNAASESLGLAFAQAATDYATGLVVDAFLCPSLTASDHAPFWFRGYEAIIGITDNEGYCGHGGNYPYYHQSTDTIANCGDPTFFYSVVRTAAATLAELADPFVVSFSDPSYACDGSIEIVVGDHDLNTDPGVRENVVVSVWSTTEPTPESVTLTEESADSMLFRGSIASTPDPPSSGDGALSVADGDLIETTYTDALGCDGSTNVVYDETAVSDCRAPVLDSVAATNITDTQATITWTSDEAADSSVHWGGVTPPGNTTSDASQVTAHAVTLGGLQECTVYYFAVESSDAVGNVAVEDAGGAFYHFETLGDFGQGLQACHAGDLWLSASTLGCSDSTQVQLVDLDLNLSSTAIDTSIVTLTSTTETDPETLVLTETGANTSTFTGTLVVAQGTPVGGDGVVQAAHGDVVTATYHDADDGTGAPAVAFRSSVVDCGPPLLAQVRVTDVTDESAVVRWDTLEATTGRVEWGATPALGQSVENLSFTTSHALTLAPLDECGRYFFRVFSTDAYGNETILDAGGQPFELNAFLIPGTIFRDDFDTDSGWTLEGEWEIAAPQGLGTSPGDPLAGFDGVSVLGHDLSGQGNKPGDYEPQTTERAESPVIDASALTNGEIEFRRWLNVGGGGISRIYAYDGSDWQQVWSSTFGSQASSWSLQTVDVSAHADGNPSLRIAFEQYGGFGVGGNRAGWNVDRFLVRDGSAPDFGPCGACGGAPTFGGVVSASDADGCSDTGVTLSWEQAPAWGTGGAGTYAVYRDETPGFAPSAANRIATGVAGTSYTDATAPNDVTLHYLVRAENDETCSSGPNNGGVTDGNLAYATAVDETSQVLPQDPGETLRVGAINSAHVRVEWAPVAAAAAYNVYRATSPQGPFGLIATVGGTFHDDVDAMGSPTDRFYVVRSVDSCGNESP